MCDWILWLLGVAFGCNSSHGHVPSPRQRALAEVAQNTTRMGIAGSKEIRHLGWLAGKVGMCVLFCVTGRVGRLHYLPVQGVRLFPWLRGHFSERILICEIWNINYSQYFRSTIWRILTLKKTVTITAHNSDGIGSSTLPAYIRPSAMGGPCPPMESPVKKKKKEKLKANFSVNFIWALFFFLLVVSRGWVPLTGLFHPSSQTTKRTCVCFAFGYWPGSTLL